MELAVQMRKGWETVAAAARWAEDRGLAAFAMPDHYLQRGNQPERPAHDSLTFLAAVAAQTDRIELVSLVSPVTFRHPAVLYKMAVTLDEISDGRFVLGVGTGWMDEEFELFGLPYPDLETRYEMTEECLAYIRAAMAEGSVPYQGSHYRLADFDPHPHPANLRLLVGGTGKSRTPRLAGRYADEFNAFYVSPERFADRAAVAKAEAAAVGRDPDDLLLSSAGPALAARTETDYRRFLERFAELTGQSPDHIEKTYEERRHPHGSGSKAAEMLAELEEAGCDRFYLQMFVAESLDDYGLMLDAYGA